MRRKSTLTPVISAPIFTSVEFDQALEDQLAPFFPARLQERKVNLAPFFRPWRPPLDRQNGVRFASVEKSRQEVNLTPFFGSVARNNRVRGLLTSGAGTAYGIYVRSTYTTVDGNQLITAGPTAGGLGIRGSGDTSTACSNNVVAGFPTAMWNCLDAGNNSLLVPQ